MLEFIISLLGILITIVFVIGTHEYAHFIVARWLNIKVLRFSLGFGKRLWHWYDKKGTEYVIALIPLGGYVKMLDEREEPVPESELPFAFNRQPFYKKFLVVLAGPMMNILCALALYWLIFVVGFMSMRTVIGEVSPHSIAAASGLKPKQEITHIDDRSTLTWTTIILRTLAHIGNQDQLKIGVKNPNGDTQTYFLNLENWKLDELNPDPLGSLGITPFEPEVPLIITTPIASSPAAMAGLQSGDKLIAIDKKPIKDWNELINFVVSHPEQKINLTIERNSQIKEIPIVIGFQRSLTLKKSGYLGIAPKVTIGKEYFHKIQFSPLRALGQAFQSVEDFVFLNLVLIAKMVTGKLSMQSLGGPITIFGSAGSALHYGFLAFISFLAFLSLSIGIINLLPIPGLDGGHLVIQCVEAVIRRPVPERVLLLLYQLGFIFIIFIIIQSLINDLLRLT